MKTSRLVRATFAVLVVATAAAFFATQRLKTEVPVVLRFAADPRHISPNQDAFRDRTRVGFDLSESATVSFAIIDSEGNQVRSLFTDRRLAGDAKYRFDWDGRDDGGRPVPDGSYRMRVVRKDRGRVLDSIKRVIVDTRPPRVRIARVVPNLIVPGRGHARVRITYTGPRNVAPEFRVWHTDVAGPPRIARRFRGNGGRTGVWDGTVRGGPTPDGSYAFTVLVRDKAGNLTEAPAGRLPTAAAARPRTGVAVRRLTLTGPSEPVSAGSLAVFRVGPVARTLRFALSRLGSRRILRTDRRRAGRLRVKIPAAAHTGIYLVRVRTAGRRAVWPVVVAGRPAGGTRALRRPRPLVVLPWATWQGGNRLDSDLDGFPDTLFGGGPVPIDRPFEDGGLPRQLSAEAAPLLAFLDRARLSYDLTTDVALARRRGPSMSNAPGVVVAGSATWLPRRVRDELRGEVERRGLRVASFGTRSLRRAVAVVGRALRDPGPDRPDDVFGERTDLIATDSPAPMRVERDRSGLFGGVDSLFGEFSRLEVSRGLPSEAGLLSAAGRDGRRALVAYRFGRGIVFRPGSPQWVGQLQERALGLEVPRVMRNLWRLLRRAG